jgi:hypothetical protein
MQSAGKCSGSSTEVAGGKPHDGATAEARKVTGHTWFVMFSKSSFYHAGMDARKHDDPIHAIVQALMDTRYAPPQRRWAAWHEGYDEET